MGVDLEVKRGVIIVLFLLGLSLVQVQTQPGTQVASSRDQVRHSQIIDPFVIENNTDFQIQGWPGNGTESDPYLLEDLVIRGVNSFYGYYCLYIWNSDAYFIIQNCTFVNPGSSFGNVIRFTNVTNGVIRNCTIIIERFGDEYRGDGIDLYSSSNILVTDCNITGGETGIELWQSTNCTISSSVLKNQMYYGIGTTFSNYTEIHNNTLMGAEFTNSRKGIGVGYLSTNFSVHDNNITNFLSAGIMLHAAVNISVFDNYVTESGTGISIGFSNQSKLISNILVKNDDGIGLAISTFNNVISSNILRNDVNNAIDHGFDNIWTSNWYSDYGGSGVYHISGEAENRDISPQPTTPHIPNLMNNIIILSLISLIPLGAAIGYHMRYREIEEGKLRTGHALAIMILSILIPCGVSSSPIPDPSLPNLRYVVTDSFFTLGISRSPGADWITDILLTTNNYLLFVSVPYLVSSILSILLLMAYLRKKTSGRILGAGLFAVIVTVMLVPLVVSVFVVPLTPILAFLITFWTNNLRFAQEEKDESHME